MKDALLFCVIIITLLIIVIGVLYYQILALHHKYSVVQAKLETLTESIFKIVDASKCVDGQISALSRMTGHILQELESHIKNETKGSSNSN